MDGMAEAREGSSGNEGKHGMVEGRRGSSGDDGMYGIAEARKGRQETTKWKSPIGDLGTILEKGIG